MTNEHNLASDEENPPLKGTDEFEKSTENCLTAQFYSPYLRYSLATLFSLGKVLQAAGQDTLGILRLLEYFNSKNPILNYNILVPLVTINAFINVSTRANKIFEYCLLPTIYLANDISAASFGEEDVKKVYIIDKTDNSLYYVGIDVNKKRSINLNEAGKGKLKILTQNASNNALNTLSSEDIVVLITPHFTSNDYRLFSEIYKKQELPSDWILSTKLLYLFLYTGCASSTVFSAATAYLSGITLINVCYPKAPSFLKISIGCYISLCAIMAYVGFNLKTMRYNVKNTCESFNSGICKGNFGIPVQVMKWTIITTSFGVLASAGMAYFSLKNAVDILPWIQDWPDAWKQALVYTNVIVSFFPSIFNFAAGCYTQLKNVLPEDTHKEIPFSHILFQFFSRLTGVNLLLTSMILIDSVSNSFGTFLGTDELLSILFNPKDSDTILQVLLGLSILITVSNVFLNFGMIMTGTEEVFQACNKRVYGNSRHTMYQPLLDTENNITPEALNNQLIRTITTTSTASNV